MRIANTCEIFLLHFLILYADTFSYVSLWHRLLLGQLPYKQAYWIDRTPGLTAKGSPSLLGYKKGKSPLIKTWSKTVAIKGLYGWDRGFLPSRPCQDSTKGTELLITLRAGDNGEPLTQMTLLQNGDSHCPPSKDNWRSLNLSGEKHENLYELCGQKATWKNHEKTDNSLAHHQ